MVRIALDCRSVFPGMGGIGRYTASLAHGLPHLAQSDEFHFLTTERKEAEDLSQAGNVFERRFPVGMIDERWEQLELPGELAAIPADLYHATCFSLPVAGGARRMVATVHDVVFRRFPELVAPRLREYLDRWTEATLGIADRVITVSEFSKQEICGLYGTDPDRIVVIYNSIDERFYAELPRGRVEEVRRHFKLPARYVLYVGSLEEKKNIPRLLQAWGMVAHEKAAAGCKLVLAGGGGGKQFDAAAAVDRAGVGGSVLLLGRVPDQELPALMAGAEVFVYPSIYEGFGLPVLEAMACGAPVITSKSSSLAEVAGEAARLAEPESADDLSMALRELLGNRELRRELNMRGKERAARFGPGRCVQETLALYHDVLGHG